MKGLFDIDVLIGFQIQPLCYHVPLLSVKYFFPYSQTSNIEINLRRSLLEIL